jgi:hypothetical protein
MAVVNGAASTLEPGASDCVWTPLLSGDTGSWMQLAGLPDRTLEVTGTFGGAAVTMQGTNQVDPNTGPLSGSGLTDQGASAISLTAAGVKLIAEATRWVRPVVTGGDGSTSLTARVVARA